MGIDDFLIVLLIVGGFIASAIQKLAERSKASRRASEDQAGRARDGAGETIRTAQRRAAAPRPAQPQPQPANIEDVIRRLMGEEIVQPLEGPSAENDEADESDWRPLAPPPIRRAPASAPPQRVPAQRVPATPPRQMQQPPPRRQAQMPQRPEQQQPASARPVRQRPARTPSEMVAQPRRLPEELTPEETDQRESERHWREEMERRKKQQAALQAQQAKQRAPEVLHARPRLQRTRGRLFHSAGEVRRAFILSEVLGPPRAMRDLEERV